VRAFIGLGSNLGDRRAHLQAAVAALPDVAAVSPVYETAPVGGPGQGRYLNCVVELATDRSPHELLAVALAIETAAGRVRAERWGPRPIDVDILLMGELELDAPDLVVPHPRLWDRAFVLVPLHDLAPDLVAPATLARVDLSGVEPAGPLDD
jgi:2-amino-4-hydroxy-6-hydroxymethyldihydropteridine diphosphokinase